MVCVCVFIEAREAFRMPGVGWISKECLSGKRTCFVNVRREGTGNRGKGETRKDGWREEGREERKGGGGVNGGVYMEERGERSRRAESVSEGPRGNRNGQD